MRLVGERFRLEVGGPAKKREMKNECRMLATIQDVGQRNAWRQLSASGSLELEQHQCSYCLRRHSDDSGLLLMVVLGLRTTLKNTVEGRVLPE
uniref:Uncharacterized protein n=1 Tax=Timema poppense TaxID=170557 RepID=A0A7R9GUC0_TIMPO|nr:unnamed protein product [Timema poppensis]